MFTKFEQIYAELKGRGNRKRMVAAWGVDTHTVAAAAKAVELGLADVTLVGDQDLIAKACAEEGVEISSFTFVHSPDELKSVAQAVQMINDGEGDFLMKGLCSTDKFLRAILNKEKGLLPPKGTLTHCTTLEIPSYHKLLFVGDVVYAGMVAEEMPNILGIVLMNDFSCKFSRSEALTNAFEHWDEDFNALYPDGFKKEYICYEQEDNPNDLAVLNYTSGTTSDPKGVMIPYRALLINMKFACANFPLQPGHTVVSILPMAHMFGLAFQLMFEVLLGCKVCYLVKMPTPKLLFDAFAEQKPTLIITVPLIIEKAIKSKVMPVLNKPVMKIAMAIPGLNNIIGGKIRNKLLTAFGGQVDSVVIGGAALNVEVEKVLRKIKFPYTVGYGSTECAPLISYCDWEKYKQGSCGIALPDTIVDVFSSDKSKEAGELLVKGDNVMLGYYKNPNATRDVIDPEGWYHTGDMGLIDKNGNIFIKGRCKNMILGASGQNIYPEELEDMINNLPYVEESLVVDRGHKLVALVLPAYEVGAQDGLTDEQVLVALEEGKKQVNALLPAYSQIAELEIRTEPFERTPKKSIRRFLYK